MVEQHRVVNSDDPGLSSDEEPNAVNSLLVSLLIDKHCFDEVRELGDRAHGRFDIADSEPALDRLRPVNCPISVEQADFGKDIGPTIVPEPLIEVLLVIADLVRVCKATPVDH